jgi:nicotinamidase-related amidase
MASNLPQAPLLAKAKLSQLVIIDMQSKLATAMPPEVMQAVIKNCIMLATAANLLEVPVLMTEQYAKGLGHSVPELLAVLPKVQAVDKLNFSCMGEVKFSRKLTRDRSQMVLVGMEAHICLLQTALDMLAVGKQVLVAEDAIISRNPAHKENAIARMREAGCIISNTESIMFEWLSKAEGDAFKAISQLIR